MGKKSSQPSERPTRKRVLQYAQELRDKAQFARRGDPNMELFVPSDDYARKVFERHQRRVGSEEAGAAAILELATRAAERELEIREQAQRASDARRRHLEDQLKARGQREAAVRMLSVGERLDRALWTLGLASEARIAQLDADRVSGSVNGNGVPRIHDNHGYWLSRLERLAAEMEREAERARRLLVEDGVAA